MENFNIEINGHRVNDVAEKIGAMFGEEGRKIGKVIDSLTKDVTIVVGKPTDGNGDGNNKKGEFL